MYETLKAVGPFYLVSMPGPGEVKDPTSPHWNVELSWTPPPTLNPPVCDNAALDAALHSGCTVSLSEEELENYKGSDYVSGARTNYRNSMCPASGYVTARKNCCKPICPARRRNRSLGGSDCLLYIICPASVDVTGIRLPHIYLSGGRPKNMSQQKSDVL